MQHTNPDQDKHHITEQKKWTHVIKTPSASLIHIESSEPLTKGKYASYSQLYVCLLPSIQTALPSGSNVSMTFFVLKLTHPGEPLVYYVNDPSS